MRGPKLLRRLAVGACVLVSLAAGCWGRADRPPLGRVSGTVRYNGKPVTSGSVIFTPTSQGGGGHVATGPIDSNGSYTLTTFDTGDGALIDKHVVTVEAREKSAGSPRDKDGRITYKPAKLVVPDKYADPQKTPFRYTVEAGSNTIDLDLKD